MAGSLGLMLGSFHKWYLLNLLIFSVKREDLVETPSVANKCSGFIMGVGGCVAFWLFFFFYFLSLFPFSPSTSW